MQSKNMMEELKTKLEKQNEVINLQGKKIKQQARKISRIQNSILEIMRKIHDNKQDTNFHFNLMKCNEINTETLLSDSESDCEPETRTCDDCGCVVLSRQYLTKSKNSKFCGACICDNSSLCDSEMSCNDSSSDNEASDIDV